MDMSGSGNECKEGFLNILSAPGEMRSHRSGGWDLSGCNGFSGSHSRYVSHKYSNVSMWSSDMEGCLECLKNVYDACS